ncbi:hypothetical protein Gotur_006516, partial [Gossypium turneri]
MLFIFILLKYYHFNLRSLGLASVLFWYSYNYYFLEQLQGLWKVKHEHMSELCEQAMKLKDKFLSFQINHVLRELNGEADAEANLAVKLAGEKVKSRRSWPKSLIVLAEVFWCKILHLNPKRSCYCWPSSSALQRNFSFVCGRGMLMG